MLFEWNENKNQTNQHKHGISFEEVQAVFMDPYDDPDHSYEEERFLIIGMSIEKGVCIVSHCYRGENDIIRIISARKATKSEQLVYKEQF